MIKNRKKLKASQSFFRIRVADKLSQIGVIEQIRILARKTTWYGTEAVLVEKLPAGQHWTRTKYLTNPSNSKEKPRWGRSGLFYTTHRKAQRALEYFNQPELVERRVRAYRTLCSATKDREFINDWGTTAYV